MKLNKYFTLLILLTILVLSYSKRNPQSSKLLPANQLPSDKPAITQKINSNQNKYSLKSGIVTFDTKIADNPGKKILYFDDYGLKEREDYYEDDKLRESVLTDGKIKYKVSYNDKTALNLGIAQRGIAYKVDWNEIPASQKKNGFAIKLENINVSGKTCESYKIDNAGIVTTFAGWEGLCLYSQQQSKLGNALTKAVKIEENVSITPDKFKLPKGIRVK